MPVVFIEILKKIAPYLKYVVFLVILLLVLSMWKTKSNRVSELEKSLDLYKRQMAGQLTDKEKALESANNNLGIARSKLMTQDNLLKTAVADGIKTSADFERFKKQYSLEIESYQKTVATLEQKISGGITTINSISPRQPTDTKPSPGLKPIDPSTSKLSYDWKSADDRFELSDPDVFTPNNETFTLKQTFRITGEIYREKAGFLKTQRISLEEVLPGTKNLDGSIIYKPIANATIVESHFNYTEKSPDSWIPHKGIFTILGVVSANFGLNNGLNPRFLLGTGIEFINWKGLGVGVQLHLDTTVWQDSGFGIDLAYRPSINSTQLNIAINLGLATQFRQPFQSYIPMLGLKFYLF